MRVGDLLSSCIKKNNKYQNYYLKLFMKWNQLSVKDSTKIEDYFLIDNKEIRIEISIVPATRMLKYIFVFQNYLSYMGYVVCFFFL